MEFVSLVSMLQEPRTYRAAASIPYWTEPMRQELTALEEYKTREIVSLSPDKSPIGCKWVYKTKLREDGIVEWHKARLVAKGYMQIEGVDYTERFSPVAKSVTVRLFLALATAFQWPLHQVDINNAFLHEHLDEEIFMTAPEGYSVSPGHACLLKLSMYGLKQASRQWNAEFTSLKNLDSGSLDMITAFSLRRCPLDLLVFSFTLMTFFLWLPHLTSFLSEAKPVATPLSFGIKLQSSSGGPLADLERYRRLDFCVPVTLPVPFHCGNQATIQIVANPVFHERTKHLGIDCHVERLWFHSACFCSKPRSSY
ncbi:UNVERIFIED_CONTAM: putative mitochondrial protein [Sesamum indicum]